MYTNYDQKMDEVDKTLVQRYSDYTATGLADIILRYLKYEQEAVGAALYVSVEKGFMTYDLKEAIRRQVDINYTSKLRNTKNYSWENKNAFTGFFSSYSDDQLYDMIDNPDGIILDVYHAVLAVARDRELISGEDFSALYSDAKSGSMDEAGGGTFGEIIRAGNDEEDPDEESFRELDREKYWKCPKCSQLVDMNFGLCWNCQTEMPEVIEHPRAEEVIREKWTLKETSLARAGASLVLAGLLMAAYEYLKPFIFSYRKTHVSGYILAGIFVLIGLVVVAYGLIFDSDSKTQQ